MRQLILNRERALGAFGIKYYCYFNRDPEFLEAISDDEAIALSDFSLRNGETVRARLDELENCFFVVVFLESRRIVTPPILIPAGEDSFTYTIHSDFDKYTGLHVRVDTEPPK